MPVFTGNWFGFGRSQAAAGAAAGPSSPVYPSDIASGGMIEVTDPGLVRHVFVNNGQFTVGPQHPGTVGWLLIGGGAGGGGCHHGGGGGAGGVLIDPSHPVPATSYPIVIGVGGQGGKGNRSASTNPGQGAPGDNSTAFGATALGGGGGGSSAGSNGPGIPGGSGGGAGGSGAPDEPGTGTQSNSGPSTQYWGTNGGRNDGVTSGWYGSAGGGGAGGAGQTGGDSGPNPENRAGNGGPGQGMPTAYLIGSCPPNGWAAVSDPSGAPNANRFAAGGGGATYAQGTNIAWGAGGAGGGGSGSGGGTGYPQNPYNTYDGSPGRNWFGCGGGGGEREGRGGGRGGDGMCVIQYTLPGPAAAGFIDSRAPMSKEIVATGGIIHEVANPDGVSVDRVHAWSCYTNPSQAATVPQVKQDFTVVSGSGDIELLLVGGGGGGGWKGGGGGGGEVVHHPGGIPVSGPNTYVVVAGVGGHGALPPQRENGIAAAGEPGAKSTFGPPTATATWSAGAGGGGGTDGSYLSGLPGLEGGSGGGVAGGGYGDPANAGTVPSNPTPNPGATGYANNGGARTEPGPSNGSDYYGGGGGGAASAGGASGDPSTKGIGGAGKEFPTFAMWGTSPTNAIPSAGNSGRGFFGGGGSGGADTGTGRAAGVGGGGQGATPTVGQDNPSPWFTNNDRGYNGLNATGGGGGGGSNDTNVATGGDGGAGIVCVRYKYIDNS